MGEGAPRVSLVSRASACGDNQKARGRGGQWNIGVRIADVAGCKQPPRASPSVESLRRSSWKTATRPLVCVDDGLYSSYTAHASRTSRKMKETRQPRQWSTCDGRRKNRAITGRGWWVRGARSGYMSPRENRRDGTLRHFTKT